MWGGNGWNNRGHKWLLEDLWKLFFNAYYFLFKITAYIADQMCKFPADYTTFNFGMGSV